MLVSAIPEHLQCPRRALPAKTPPNFQPPFPAYSAGFPKEAKDLIFAVIGAQYASEAAYKAASGDAVAQLTHFTTSKAVEAASRPQFAEWAAVTDNRGFYNLAHLAYWSSKTAYDAWSVDSGFKMWWAQLDNDTDNDSESDRDAPQAGSRRHGWFLEVFMPTADRFETVFSNDEVPEGAAHMRERVIGPIKEHVYWGSMRDRMAAAQNDELVGEKVDDGCRGVNGHGAPTSTTTTSTTSNTTRRRVRVSGKHNLAVIRSGQDWSATLPEERELYLSTMHPVLTKGMNFLRDHGAEVGCHSCRFMTIVDPLATTGQAEDKNTCNNNNNIIKNNKKDRTFGLAFFDDLASLEAWAKEHSTHLEIFGGFLQYARKLENNVSLRLFHEVLVLKPEQQWFEYIGCHSETGLMAIL